MTKLILSSSTFLTYSLGCRVNQAEISAISSQLSAISMEIFGKAKHAFPDIVLINTCAVTQKAERESRKAIHHFKSIYPKAKVIALGCAAKMVKDADLVIENSQKPKTVETILKIFSLTPGRCQAKLSSLNSFQNSGRALVKIQEGCDQFCAYCIVPYLRGKPKSVPVKEIICQINKLVEQGIKEIILCGINLSLYGKDLVDSSPSTQNCGLTALIKKILKETKAERISLSSIEPEYLYQNSEFIELFINEPRLSKYFHLALQSGSSDTLKNMGRRTNLKKLLKTLRFIKEKCPEFIFRADIIVGFPTETEKNFQETLEFIRKAPITFAHVFPFSTRQGTLAEKKIRTKKWHDLPMEVKKERAKRITELTRKIQKEEAEKLIGKSLPCLIIKKIPGGYEAMAGNSWTVRISHQPALRRGRSSTISSQTPIGQILPIKIINHKDNYLRGRILSFPT